MTFVKKAEWGRIDAFELWCWRRFLRVPWTARRSNQSILKEISPGISLEGMMLKLKLQYFSHLIRRVDSLEKTLMLGGIWRQEEKGMTEDEMAGWHHWLDGRESEWAPGVGDGQGGLECCDSWGRKKSDMTGRLKWTELKMITLAAGLGFLQTDSHLLPCGGHHRLYLQSLPSGEAKGPCAMLLHFPPFLCFSLSHFPNFPANFTDYL